MLPDPARYEERYRPTGAALGLASALLALGLGFLWHTQLIFAALTVLLAIPAVLAIARRPVAFRADHAGITLGSWLQYDPHMADFEGAQLIGKGSVGGCVLMLRASPDASRILSFPEDVEVEIRRGVPALIIRGMAASDYESLMLTAPEVANRALDIFAMTGVARLAVADVWSSHVARWSALEATVTRVWCSATLILASEIKVVVNGPDGAVHSQDIATTPSWHESIRYFRMSEVTDDLFDAFRNVYLALESLLNKLEPRKAGEREGMWLKRALVS
jgi:hypothetical protein